MYYEMKTAVEILKIIDKKYDTVCRSDNINLTPLSKEHMVFYCILFLEDNLIYGETLKNSEMFVIDNMRLTIKGYEYIEKFVNLSIKKLNQNRE